MRVRAQQVPGRERRHRSRAPRGQFAAIDEGEAAPVARVMQQIGRRHRRQPDVAVARKDGCDLHPEVPACLPGRHEEQGRVQRPRHRYGMVMAQRRLATAAQQIGERIRQPLGWCAAGDLSCVDHFQHVDTGSGLHG
jgi:hypothetical protein